LTDPIKSLESFKIGSFADILSALIKSCILQSVSEVFSGTLHISQCVTTMALIILLHTSMMGQQRLMCKMHDVQMYSEECLYFAKKM
jgi:hypothetical protein